MDKKFCTSCGSALTPGAKFCVACGAPVAMTYEQPQQTYEQPQQTYEQPQQTYEQPQQTYEQPQQAYQQPQQTYEQPQQTYEQPQQTYEQPQQTYEQPQQTYEQPQQTYQQPQQPVNKHAGKDYHSLGGWLLVFVIGNFVSVLYGLGQIRESFTAVSESSDYAALIIDYSGIGYFIGLYMLLAVQIFGIVVNIIYPIKVIKRNSSSLRFLQLTTIIESGIFLTAVIILIASIGMDREFFVTAISGIFGSAASFVLFTLYYMRSVRVRTYFGSEEYMRKALVGKNAVLPDPID
ncbi:MAG: zinc-ribbon domain-containing protein [Lachnospiraceae bacterium]|nr:zinc-ribbon domain-containing protein [Lachnospiraceae bacterium]